VFGVIPDFGKFFNNKLGITFDQVKTNQNADYISVTRPMTTYEEKVLTNSIERIYSTFIGHVAEGRSMQTAEVDSIGQGRVWSGIDGIKINLADEAGGLRRALEIAAGMANLEDYRTISLPSQKDPFTQIIDDLTGNPSDSKMKEELGILYPYYKQIISLSRLEGIQARMPYEVEIH
jgi:protease-4